MSRIETSFEPSAERCGDVSPSPCEPAEETMVGLTPAETREFMALDARNQIDEKNKTLKLSKIFDWYAKDFGGSDNITKYVGKYAGKDLSGYKITFLDYSWELNSTNNDASHR